MTNLAVQNARVKLNNGKTMPALGLGTWKSVGAGEVETAIVEAVKAGYRLIDGAAIYMNEVEVGQGIRKSIDLKLVEREDLFVTSKLWNTHHLHVREACLQTLKDLQLEYLDLYLIHWPVAFAFGGLRLTADNFVSFDKEGGNVQFEKVSLQETWREMEKLVDEGLVKSIGVSNFTIPLVLDLLTYCRIKPVVNQFEVHPYFVRPSLRHLLAREQIVVTAYSPLGSGQVGPLQDAIVADIAKKHGKSPAQILIKWSIQHGHTVIPKSSNRKRISENANIFDFELTQDQMKSLDGLDKNFRVCTMASFLNGFEFTEA
jgi:diketogulonate reductase-like aldo/keto reductase